MNKEENKIIYMKPREEIAELDIIPLKEGNNYYPEEKSIYHYNIRRMNAGQISADQRDAYFLDKVIQNIQDIAGTPKEIREAEILAILERNTGKIIKIINNGYVKKEELKKLTRIDDPGFLKFSIERIIGEEKEWDKY